MALEQSPQRRAAIIAAIDSLIASNKLADYAPYLKQREFHSAGATFRERLFIAGNQLGKTWAGGYETAIHLTGRYPDWWSGKEFTKPIASWAAGVTGEATRDTVQRICMGRPNSIGTGSIPKSAIKDKTAKRGVADAIDTVVVAHGGGGDVQAGESTLTFKSYDQGREKFQGETLELVWLDEEPAADIYTEALTRTNTTGGTVFVTFTPLQGMSTVVARFMIEKSPGTVVINMTIDDAKHYTPAQRIAIIASYPAHEREARAKGIPTLGSGRIFPVPEEDLLVKPFQIPDFWPRIIGMDFGWDHPTAAANCAWDRDADCFYVTHTHRLREATPILHATAIKSWGSWIPVAWPHDGLQHDKGSGEQLAAQYKTAGLKMLKERATFEDGSNGVEAGLMDVLQRMQTGRFKVFNTCVDFLEEFRMYHRKDGKVVKERDDILSATRYALMMKRKAITKPTARSSSQDSYEPLDSTMNW